MKIRNASGRDLLVPALGDRLVLSGAVVEIPDDDAPGYVCQGSTWREVKSQPSKTTKAQSAPTEKGDQK